MAQLTQQQATAQLPTDAAAQGKLCRPLPTHAMPHNPHTGPHQMRANEAIGVNEVQLIRTEHGRPVVYVQNIPDKELGQLSGGAFSTVSMPFVQYHQQPGAGNTGIPLANAGIPLDNSMSRA